MLAVVEQRQPLPDHAKCAVESLDVWQVTEAEVRARLKETGATP